MPDTESRTPNGIQADRRLLQRLGRVVVTNWSRLPAEAQELIKSRMSNVDPPLTDAKLAALADALRGDR